MSAHTQIATRFRSTDKSRNPHLWLYFIKTSFNWKVGISRVILKKEISSVIRYFWTIHKVSFPLNAAGMEHRKFALTLPFPTNVRQFGKDKLPQNNAGSRLI